jgi:hypothetical protein
VAGIAIFAALAYAGSFLLIAIPNATLSILLVFYAGFFLGPGGGALVGLVGSLLISLFNPYGFPAIPILFAQVSAYTCIGTIGGIAERWLNRRRRLIYYILLALLGLLTAVIYQLPVSLADAWLFGPFRERLILSAGFAVITLASNVVFFVILFPALAKLKELNIFQANR